VALLAVPELRRALDAADSELPTQSRADDRRTSTVPPSNLSQPPASLPPAPPLSLLNPAAAGVGELRLRSIAQGQDLGVGRSKTVSRTGLARLQRLEREALPKSSQLAHGQRNAQSRLGGRVARQTTNSGRWHWRAFERVAWAAAGVVAVFVVSGSGSADEKSERHEPPALLLAADRLDPVWGAGQAGGTPPSLAESLLGPRQQCLVHTDYCQPTPATSGNQARAEEPTRDGSPTARPQTTSASSQRGRVAAPPRVALGQSQQQSETTSDFNFDAIRAALYNAAALARSCRGNGIRGKAIVTFEPGGSVRSVDIPLLIGDKPDRACIVRAFKNLRVPPYSGQAVAVKKDF
jgi:hypothetical protein